MHHCLAIVEQEAIRCVKATALKSDISAKLFVVKVWLDVFGYINTAVFFCVVITQFLIIGNIGEQIKLVELVQKL